MPKNDGQLELSPASSPDTLSCELGWCAELLPAARLFAIRHAGGADGEDLAQEAITLLLLAIREGRVANQAAAGGFLLSTCRNLAQAHWRKSQRRDALLEREVAAVAGVSEPIVIERRRLWGCLNQLGSRARDVILRSYLLDETASEIADGTGLSEANIRVIRHRSLTALHRCLSGEGTP